MMKYETLYHLKGCIKQKYHLRKYEALWCYGAWKIKSSGNIQHLRGLHQVQHVEVEQISSVLTSGGGLFPALVRIKNLKGYKMGNINQHYARVENPD